MTVPAVKCYGISIWTDENPWGSGFSTASSSRRPLSSLQTRHLLYDIILKRDHSLTVGPIVQKTLYLHLKLKNIMGFIKFKDKI